MNGAPRRGFVGLGDIGLPMARRLLAVAGGLVAWNRSSDKLAALASEGATAAHSPADLASRCDVIGLCLTSHDAVEAVAFGPEGLLSAQECANRVIVDFSTGSPGKAIAFARRAAAVGARWVDAPISGGVPGAQAGTLTVFAGGEPADVAAARPLTDCLAARVSHMGPSGAGQTTKLCNQMMVACGMMVMAETIAAARRAGVDVALLPQALKGGFADSAPFQIFGPRMADHVFEPRLGAIGLMAKDLRLARDMASGAAMPVSAACMALYEQAEGAPSCGSDADIAALVGLFEPLAARAR